MATENYGPTAVQTCSGAADLTGKETFAAVINSSGLLALAGANVVVDGIIVEGKTAARASTIQTGGTARVIAGGTFNAGVSLTTDSSGRAVLATTGQLAFGRSREAGVLSKIVSVNIDRHAAP